MCWFAHASRPQATPKPPRAWRVLPLLAGLAELGYFVIRGGQESVGEETEVMLSGFVLIIVGLLVGPGGVSVFT